MTLANNGGAAGTAGGNGRIVIVGPPSPPPAPSGGGGSSAPVKVTLGLDLNGGSGSVSGLSGDRGSWVTLPGGEGLSKPGYVFAGWNSAPDGSGTTYAAGASVELIEGNTLYALWRVEDGSAGSSEGSGVSNSQANPQLGPIQTGLPAGGLPAGGSVLLSNGQSVPVTVSPNAKADPVALVVQGPSLTPPLNMRLEGRGDESDPLGLTSKQALILQSEPATRGLRSKVRPVAKSSGDGFKANSPVQFYILPNTYLGELTTDATGAYDGSVPVPAGITKGVYTLQANGFAPDGSVRSLSIGVLVKSTGKPVRSTKASTRVFFAPMSAQVTVEGKQALRRLVAKTGKDVSRVVSVGYVEPTASSSNDQSLSTQRARNVAAYLREIGVQGRYVIQGDGRAAETGATGRRVQVTITYPR